MGPLPIWHVLKEEENRIRLWWRLRRKGFTVGSVNCRHAESNGMGCWSLTDAMRGKEYAYPGGLYSKERALWNILLQPKIFLEFLQYRAIICRSKAYSSTSKIYTNEQNGPYNKQPLAGCALFCSWDIVTSSTIATASSRFIIKNIKCPT